MSTEVQVQEWLESLVATAGSGDALYQVDVLDTAFDPITRPKSVMIGPAEGELAPSPAGARADEYGAEVTLILMARVESRAAAKFKEAREAVITMAQAVAFAAFYDGQLGGRVRDSLPGRLRRTFTPHDGQTFAVGNLPLYVNVAGQQLGGNS